MKREDSKKGGFKEATKEFKEELLRIDRVTRVTAGGRQLRFRASVIIGDNNGTVGLGIGKAGEVVVAIEKAIRDAKKNLVKFKIVGGTIAHNVTADFKSASIMIHPASAGTGIIAGGAVRKIISVSGIKDILAKRYGCTNPITNARATLKALQLLKVADVRSAKSAPAIEETSAPAPEAPAAVVEAPKKEEKAPAAKKAAPTKKAPAKKSK